VQKDTNKTCSEKEPTVLQIESVDYSLVDKIVSLLPPNKPRYIPGPFSPSQMLELISRGIDLFDTSFVSRLADEGRVLFMNQNHYFVNESL
jgi:tRNA-guanine family transglycosylase